MLKRFTFFSCVLTGLIFFVASAHAVTISPLRFLVTLDPGSLQTVTVNIKNTDNQNITVRPVVLGAQQDSSGQTKFSVGASSAEKWVESDVVKLAVAPGVSKDITFTITAPIGTTPGSYYLAIGGEQVSGGGQIGLAGRVLAILTVQVSGTAQEKVSITKWNLEKYFTTKKIWPAHLELKNDGNVEVPAEAKAILRDWRGNELKTFSLLDQAQFLSASTRFVDQDIAVGKTPFWPGIYQMQAQINYGLTSQTITAIDYLFYLPTWSVVALIIIILCIIGAFTSRYKFEM